jgi:1-acylglycerone phosphate reductase
MTSISNLHAGLHVIATARRLESMAELAAQGIETLELDVTNDDSVRKTRDAAAKLIGGKLDILVNNAYVTCQQNP